jgi:sporulation protein YlmC with PRC-barrel domain
MTMTNRYGISAALAVLLAASSPAAFAAMDTTTTQTRGNEVARTIQPDQIRAHKMIGSSVYDRNNVKIGSVQDLILDKDGRVDLVVVDVGSFLGMGGKDVAVKFSDIKTDNNRLTLDVTKEKLRQMQAFELTNRNTGAGTTQSPVHGGKLGSTRR